MAEDKLSAREAALIAQARLQMSQSPAPRTSAPAAPRPERAKPGLPAGATESAAPAARARAMDPLERAVALMAAARAESAELRRRQRRLWVRAALALLCVAVLWTLLYLRHMP